MRADRLIATLLLLQRRGHVTAREVAEELEVSEKTARRDLEALAMAGLPVYSKAGRGGGWHLLGGGRTDLTGLNVEETRSLFMAIATGGDASGAGGDVESALRKLLRALPETFRADAELAPRAVIIDPTSWRDDGRESSPATTTTLEPLQRAVIERRPITLGYADRRRTVTERTVRPLGLVSKGRIWYLLGETDNGLRTFRVDRMQTVSVTDTTFDRPRDFDLAAAWRSVVAAVNDRRVVVSATILVNRAHVAWLRHQFGDDMVLAEIEAVRDPDSDVDPRETVMVGGPSPCVIAEHLAGWGSLVEVIEPEAVRQELRRLGAELSGLYG